MRPLIATFSLVVFFVCSTLQASNPQVFEESGADQGLTLNHEKLTVAGDNNTLVILGFCSALVVTGSNNIIKVQAVDAIEVAGSGNTITWSAGVSRDLPEVTDQGKENTIQAGEVSANDE
jgi:hypothetical protein